MSSGEYSNGNGNGTSMKLVWWILGGFVGLVGIFVTASLNKMGALDDRVRTNEIALASIKDPVGQVKEVIQTGRQVQLEMINKYGELNASLTEFKLGLKLLEDRYKTMSERILAINQRLDRVPQARGDPSTQPPP